jgi:DNA segregation ATPase FtsK/SpoIIIE-like protein
MDEELFRKLFEQGLITDRPPEMWMPMQTKDRQWTNYYTGRGGVTMHLAGGWMMNVDTHELTQIASSTEVDEELIQSVQSVFDQLGYEYEAINDSFGHAIVVRHQFSILGRKSPLSIRFREYGFDPNKSMNETFEKVLHSELPDRFEVVVNHVPEYDDDGEELGTFGETGVEFTTEIDRPITVDDFPKFVKELRKEIDNVLAKLKKYRFDNESSAVEQKFYPLEEALDSKEYNSAKGSLLFPIGKDDSGKFVIADLHKLPHIMAGGQTGSGKSNFTEGTLILSLLNRYSADDLKLVLIDPKMVQFTQYNGLPHLLRPVITTPEDSKDAIDWLVGEMESRFTTLAKSGHKDIVEFNSTNKEHLPFIVLIIDEVADLMMVDGEHYQKSFIKLLQKSAAVGIHIYIGTSRPSEDVLPSLLRANFVTKIAFKTASEVDSEALIDASGAEYLRGRGDLLFSSLDSPRPVHLQAPYASDEDMAKFVEGLKT